MVFLICAYVHFRLSLEFLGLKIKNLKIRDGGRVQAGSVENLGDLHGISSEFPNDPCISDC